MAREVDQLAPDLRCGESVKLFRGCGFYLGKRSMQSQQGVLQNVIGLLPSVEPGVVVVQHLAGEAAEPFTSMGDDLISRQGVAFGQKAQHRSKLRRVATLAFQFGGSWPLPRPAR